MADKENHRKKENKNAEVRAPFCVRLMLCAFFAISMFLFPALPVNAAPMQETGALSGPMLLSQAVMDIPEGYTGWAKDSNGGRYYFVNGTMKKGWREIDGYWYHFDSSNGKMDTGWTSVGKYWYFMDQNGIMLTGWLETGNRHYFFDDEGRMVTGWKEEDGYWYYFDGNGRMQTGWVSVGKHWYYMDESGRMKTGWISAGRYWYYMDQNGRMKTGWLNEGNNWYYLDAKGHMATGWLSVGNYWYYMGTNGKMRTGWVAVGQYWYYLNEKGQMLKNIWLRDDIEYYYFNSEGHMLQNSWANGQGGKKYYFASNGKRCVGPWKIDGKWYSFNDNGEMQTGWVNFGKQTFYFDSYGRMVSGKNTIGGKAYNFNDYGLVKSGLGMYESFARLTIEDWQTVKHYIRYNISSSMTRAEKIKVIHDWLVKHIRYDTTYHQHNASATLSNGLAVCSGYAALFMAVMDELGIPCMVISGTTINSSNGSGHAWNAVQMESGWWYYVDVTWDDPIVNDTSDYPNGANLRYKYFLVGSTTMDKDHYPESTPTYVSTSDYAWK